MKELGLRVEIDVRPERMQAKIRDAQVEKIPYMLVIGDKEMENDSIAVRPRTGKDMGMMKTDDFIRQVLEEIKTKKL
jgi:threonyl-tRNA synthetase